VIRDFDGEDVEFRDCPARLVTEWSWSLLKLHQHYTAGFLPFSGGMMSQPAVFADAMRIISVEIHSG
jgi:hypothetical protein